MGSWVSELGVWKPAKEKAVNRDTGELYEGPDRVATEFLKEEGVSHLGMDARKDPENIMRARQLGMSVEEFLQMNVPPTPEALANEEKKKNLVVTHYTKKTKKGVNVGRGGFYDPEKGQSPV